MAVAKLFIRVSMSVSKAVAGLGKLRMGLGLVGSALRAVFRTAVVAGFFMAIRMGIKTFQQLKTAISKNVAEMVKLNTASLRTAVVLTKGSAETAKAFADVSEQARSLSTQVAYTAIQIQEGLFTAAIAGYNLGDSLTVATASMKMASIAGYDFKSTIDGVIGVVNAFHFSMEDIPEIADTMTAAFSHSKMTLEGFFTAIKYVASAAAVTFGSTAETFRDVTAALMTMNQAGLTSSKSGVYLRSAMLKLNSATSKVTAVAAKYGVNLYDAEGATQNWIPTIYKAQEATGLLTEELNKLKMEQLIIATTQGTTSTAFKNMSLKVSDVTGRLEELKSGLGDVFKEFTLSGGKLKPLRDILIMLSKKVPTEVMQRAFGIRSGQGIGLLLDQIDEYEKNLKTLEKYSDLSQAGESIVSNMFSKMMGAIGLQWQRVINSLVASFSVVSESMFKALAPTMDILVEYFNEIYKIIEGWSPLFDRMFGKIMPGLLEPLKGFLEDFGEALEKVDDILTSDISTGGVDLPMYSYDRAKGEVARTDKLFPKGTSQKDLMRGLGESFTSAIKANLDKVLTGSLGEAMEFAAEVFVKVLKVKLLILMPIFKTLGVAVGEGIREGLTNWFGSEEGKKASEKLMGGEVKGKGLAGGAAGIAWQQINPLYRIGKGAEALGTLSEGSTAWSTEIKDISLKLGTFLLNLKESFNFTRVNEKLDELEPPKDTLEGIKNVLGSWANIYGAFKGDMREIEQRMKRLEDILT